MRCKCHGRVLDAGSGRGAWCRTILAAAESYESIDREARGGEAVTWVGDLASMPQVPEARYGTVVCHQALEHVPAPTAALAEMRWVLKPGGWLIASEPHLSRLHELPRDCFRYTSRGLCALLGRAGFAAIETRTYGGPFSFLHHERSFLLPGLLTGIPVVGHLPLGVLALARKPV